ncbi:MAG: CvpA family protein [Rhodospirillales bacterium]|nr:CvpA family protein [Rhodospirillales bacterium]
MPDNLPLNAVDIGVLIELLLGALVGLALGFVRGGLFIASWTGAAVATIFGLPVAQPYARQYIDDRFFADLAAGVTIFLFALVILFLISSVIGGWVRNSRLNALDRSLGMVAGLATSVLLLAGTYVAAENIWPGNKKPSVIQEAKVTPVIRASAQFLNNLLPKELEIFGAEAVGTATHETKEAVKKRVFERLVRPDTPKSGDEERPGYDTKERNMLERAIDRFNHSSP